jgi:hypothetical protein
MSTRPNRAADLGMEAARVFWADHQSRFPLDLEEITKIALGPTCAAQPKRISWPRVRPPRCRPYQVAGAALGCRPNRRTVTGGIWEAYLKAPASRNGLVLDQADIHTPLAIDRNSGMPASRA